MRVNEAFGEWNVGDRPVDQVVPFIMQMFNDGCAAVALEEVADRQGQLDVLEQEGLQTYRGDGRPGAASVALVWNPAKLERRGEGRTLKVTEAFWSPLGRGPKHLKAKYILSQEFRHPEAHRFINFGVTHVIPSVTASPKRKAVASAHIIRAADWMDNAHGIAILMGDFNMKPDNDFLEPLHRKGFESNHDVLGAIPTMGRRGIDMFWTEADDSRIKITDHETLPTPGNDHQRLIVDVSLSVRK